MKMMIMRVTLNKLIIIMTIMKKIIDIQMKKMVLEVLLSQMRMKSSMRMNLTYVLLLLLGKNKTVNFHTPIKERNITNVSQRTMISIGVH